MAPNTQNQAVVTEEFHTPDFTLEKIGTDYSFKHKIVWPVVAIILSTQIAGIYGFYLLFTSCLKPTVYYFLTVAYLFGGPSVVLGAHRLYTHRQFKATWPLRLGLMIGFTCLGQNSMYTWVRDHRLHHKYTDTDADPHNVKRGLFFAHMGWLMCKKHPKVIEKGRTMYMDDLESDWMVMFQRKYFPYLYFLTNIIIVLIPVYYWNETLYNSFFINWMAHYLLSLHTIWTINSFAHFSGRRPYDKSLQPVDNWLIHMTTLGEGMHNYHHTFPWDYRSAAFTHWNEGWEQMSFSTFLIEILAKVGLIYDRKFASKEMISQRAKKTGDGSYKTLVDK